MIYTGYDLQTGKKRALLLLQESPQRFVLSLPYRIRESHQDRKGEGHGVEFLETA